MSLISLLLNLLWIVFGGLWMALGWVIAAVVMAITIVGLPWARAAFNIATYTLLPFGYRAVPRDEYFGREDVGTGPLGVIGNIVWLVLAGWWLEPVSRSVRPLSNGRCGSTRQCLPESFVHQSKLRSKSPSAS
jgi:uncharacterized membrane protein YccF (DUF307 family)